MPNRFMLFFTKKDLQGQGGVPDAFEGAGMYSTINVSSDIYQNVAHVYNNELFDISESEVDLIDLVSDNTRITVKVKGIYGIAWNTLMNGWDNGPSQNSRLYVNGGLIAENRQTPQTQAGAGLDGYIEMELNVDDYVRSFYYHGGAYGTLPMTEDSGSPYLTLTLIRETT